MTGWLRRRNVCLLSSGMAHDTKWLLFSLKSYTKGVLRWAIIELHGCGRIDNRRVMTSETVYSIIIVPFGS